MTHPGHTATKEWDANPGPSDSRSKHLIHDTPQDSQRDRNQRRELRDNFLKEKKQDFFNEPPDETKLYLVSSPIPALNPQRPSPSPFFFNTWECLEMAQLTNTELVQFLSGWFSKSLASLYSKKKKKSVSKLIQSWLVYIKITNIFHGILR